MLIDIIRQHEVNGCWIEWKWCFLVREEKMILNWGDWKNQVEKNFKRKGKSCPYCRLPGFQNSNQLKNKKEQKKQNHFIKMGQKPSRFTMKEVDEEFGGQKHSDQWHGVKNIRRYYLREYSKAGKFVWLHMKVDHWNVYKLYFSLQNGLVQSKRLIEDIGRGWLHNF